MDNLLTIAIHLPSIFYTVCICGARCIYTVNMMYKQCMYTVYTRYIQYILCTIQIQVWCTNTG